MRISQLLFVTFLALAAVAEAHVTVQPRESKAGATEKYSMRVPTEGKVLRRPPSSSRFRKAWRSLPLRRRQGTKYTTTRSGDRMVTITWTTEIKPGESQQLSFTALNPAQGAEIVWKVRQRYADGTSSDWVGVAGSRAPAPVTKARTAISVGVSVSLNV